MLGSYVRRKSWEYRLLAAAVVNAIGEAMNGSKTPPTPRKSSLDDLLRVASSPVLTPEDL